MRTIDCWDDLRPFGIDPLTGEACGLAMRLLCDVTETGKRHLENFLGGTVTISPGSNWNGGRSDDPHVGSVLLPRSILTELAAFLLVVTGSATVVTMRSGSVAELDSEHFERYRELDATRDPESKFPRLLGRIWRRSTDPGTGDRNEHVASGRIE